MPNTSHPGEAPAGAKIIRNVSFGVLRALLVFPIPLLLTPFIIKHVGQKGLGIWAVFLAVNGLTSLADLGFVGTLTKHVSEHFAKRDHVQLNQTINAGLVIFASAAVIFAAILNIISGFVIRIFFQQASLPPVQLQHALRILSISVVLNLLALPFSSVILGLQRLDLAHFISSVYVVVMALSAAFALATGFGTTGLAFAIAAGALTNFLASTFTTFRLLPEFKISLRSVQRQAVKELFSFSLRMYVTQLAVLVHTHIEKFLLAHFSSLASVGWFDIANDLSLKSRGIPSLLLFPLLPAAVDLQARDEQDKVFQLYKRSQKYLAVVGVLIVVLTALLARRFVSVWLGAGFAPVAAALIVLTIMQLINLITGPGFFIFIGRGELTPSMYLAATGMVLNVILSTILIMQFGFAGAVIGTAVSLSLVSLGFVVVFHKRMKYPASLLLGGYPKPLCCGLLLAIITRVLVPVDHLGWLGMVVTSFIVVAAYLAGLAGLRYFDAFDVWTVRRALGIERFFRRASGIA